MADLATEDYIEQSFPSEGPLGVQLRATDLGVAIQQAPDELDRLVPGLILTHVAGQPIHCQPFQSVVAMIKTSPRPLILRFVKPAPDQTLEQWVDYARAKLAGDWSDRELTRLTAFSIAAPIPGVSYLTKLMTGGRTPTALDPIFMALGLDQFWTAENVSVKLCLQRNDWDRDTLVERVRVHWADQELGLRLKPLCDVEEVPTGAMVSTVLKDEMKSSGACNGQILVRVSCEGIVHDTVQMKFEEVVTLLKNCARPVELELACISKALGAIWMMTLASLP